MMMERFLFFLTISFCFNMNLLSAQIQYHLGIGAVFPPPYKVFNITFDEDTYAIYETSLRNRWRFELLSDFALGKNFDLRTGLAGQPVYFYGEVLINQTASSGRQILPKDYRYVNLLVPLELQYNVTSWLSVYAGLMGSFYINITSDRFERYPPNFDLTREERADYYNAIDDKIKAVNLTYRTGITIKYKRLGLELGYDHLINNILNSPFSYNGIRQREKLTYGNLHLKILYNFNWPWMNNKLDIRN